MLAINDRSPFPMNPSVTLVGKVGGATASLTGHGAQSTDPVGHSRMDIVQQDFSHRNPTSTMGITLLTQLQFLATLSLVDSTTSDTGVLSFFQGLRYWMSRLSPASPV